MNRIRKRKSEDVGVHSGSGTPYVDKDDLKIEEFSFSEKVKDRLNNLEDYQAFLKCLDIYNTEIITRKELQRLVSDLLGKHPDLMEGFTTFLGRENIDGFLADVMDKSKVKGMVPNLLGQMAKKGNIIIMLQKRAKSIQELDLSDCQRCTPISQRSELVTQVLNDLRVSVTSGSEDYSFKHMRRNYLFRCEDDTFELDMLLESVCSTAKRVKELLNNINNKTISPETPIRIEDYFTGVTFSSSMPSGPLGYTPLVDDRMTPMNPAWVAH
ncbi:hypothetical protein LXL04_020533 [Taraxacum kok-saghyz]